MVHMLFKFQAGHEEITMELLILLSDHWDSSFLKVIKVEYFG